MTGATPPAAAGALAAIEASRLGPAQKKALRLVAEGRSYRDAAKAADLRSTAKLRAHAARFGLVDAHKAARRALVAREEEIKTEVLIAGFRRTGLKSVRELLRRLDEEPEKIQTRDLTVLAGVSADKIRAWEGNWDHEDAGPDRGAKMFELLERLTAGGNRVELKVEPAPDPAGCDSRVTDLTPAGRLAIAPAMGPKGAPPPQDGCAAGGEGVEV
jgi:hypothetical protein